MQEWVDQILDIVRGAWPYRWHAVVAAWVVAVAGWTTVHRLPDRYEVQARVYVDTQSALRPLLTGLVAQPNLEQMVTMMGRTLLSRLNVEKVVQMAGLDEGLDTLVDRERLIARLIEDLKVRSAGRENLYTIAYTDVSAERAQRVVKSLLTVFEQTSLRDKRRDSDSAQQFIEEQLSNYADQLSAAEHSVTEFKRRHPGLISGSGEGRDFYARLSDASDAHRQAMLDVQEAQQSRDVLRRQLAGDTEEPSTSETAPQIPRVPPELDVRIRTLEQKLDELRLTYTDEHPDVVETLQMLSQLKERRSLLEAGGSPVPRAARVPVSAELTVALATAEARVAAAKARAAEYGKRLSELQAAASALPAIEAEYKRLTRDYDVIKARYDLLSERRESARISRDVDASDVGLGFRVIDPPQVPLSPSSPDRTRLTSLVLLVAIGAGLGFAFLISQMKTTFNDERKLRQASGIRVLGTVAMAWNEGQRKRRAVGVFALALSFLGLLAVYSAILASLHGVTIPGLG